MDNVVTIGEDIGLDANLLADRALDGEPAAVDLRPNALDDDTAPPVEEGRELGFAFFRGGFAYSLTRASGHAPTLPTP